MGSQQDQQLWVLHEIVCLEIQSQLFVQSWVVHGFVQVQQESETDLVSHNKSHVTSLDLVQEVLLHDLDLDWVHQPQLTVQFDRLHQFDQLGLASQEDQFQDDQEVLYIFTSSGL